jgi:hypothetical protein
MLRRIVMVIVLAGIAAAIGCGGKDPPKSSSALPPGRMPKPEGVK